VARQLSSRFHGSGPEVHEPFVSQFLVGTKVRHTASSTIQGLYRDITLRLKNRSIALMRVLERKREIADEAEARKKEAEENDEDFNELVLENEKLGVENVSMMYEIQRMREEMRLLKERVDQYDSPFAEKEAIHAKKSDTHRPEALKSKHIN
jgi:hypothetical protein